MAIRPARKPPALPAGHRLLPGEWYDYEAADQAVAFFATYLRLTTGEWAGRAFVLEPWQEAIVRPLFGWKRADGTRKFRRCIVWVPRKNGKTELAAGIALLMLVGDMEPSASVLAIAKDKDQARLVFDKAVAMVQASPALSQHLQCFRPSIFCPANTGHIKPLSGVPEGKHGLNMSGLIGDEVHEWPDDRLYTFVHQSSASRRQPLEFLISTAGEKRGYGVELWDWCVKLTEGVQEDAETLVILHAADPEDDWTDPATWAAANPNLGVSVKLDYLAAECAKARTNPRLENDFKRYHLNIWTEQAERWISLLQWDSCAGEVAWQDLEQQLAGRPCYGGVDLSQTRDLTALVWMFPPLDGEKVWTVLPRFFVPGANIAERVKRDRVGYDLWERSGALQATDGNVVDYEWVKAQIRADAQRFDVRRIGFDPWNALQIMIQLQQEGYPAEQVRQGYLSLSGPSKELERMVLDGHLAHGGQPVLRWCAANVATEQDAAGNIKPSKARSNERIDGIAALVTALAPALSETTTAASVYEDRGLLMVG